ncbi:MAG: hypothetical protein NZL91_00015 [Thermoflexales bacterium]|nr:hypothetical protein [Thermoflexales bacterium]MCS7324368.1 hypothetical protein [Thermoflexales bacterium]MCX7939835.1 hypothetical protein [Thermoflexales bacterium]MDW8054902.1 hypothetical protein [Anaerolineae bacterium]MDW8293367.1 hypothetical protein [Anaerolineae bacterium]
MQPTLGFALSPPVSVTDPGYPSLEVILLPEPTHQHYDPRQLTVVVAYLGGTRVLDVRHPWHAVQHRVCAGRIRLVDFVDKPMQFFCFGGDLAIESNEHYTRCVITSKAPILRWPDEELPVSILASLCEVLLARRRAAWLSRPAEFEARLASADPVRLYVACLYALRQHLGANGVDDGRRGLRRLVSEALHGLQTSGRLPFGVLHLEQLL